MRLQPAALFARRHIWLVYFVDLVCLVGLFYLVGWSSLAVNRLVHCSVCWYAGQLTIIVAQWRIGSGQ